MTRSQPRPPPRCLCRVPRAPAVAVIAAAACGSVARGAPPRAPAPTTTVPAAPALELLDAGELTVTVRGRRTGSEQFSIARTAAGYRLTTEVRLESGDALRLFDSVLDTDRSWRPRQARGRDVRDGGTRSTLGGAPLVLATTSRLAPPTARTASRAVELFLGDHTFSHFAPTCALAVPTERVGFPGMDVRIGADRGTALAGVTRRTVDLAGAMRAVVTCRGDRLLAVELPGLGTAAVRTELADALAPLILPTPEKAALPASAVEHERALSVDGATLACGLVVPAVARRPVAVAVLLTGSGPQDRDEDPVGPGGMKLGLLRAIAGALAEVGVASLRCDDRGAAGSTGDFGAATVPTFVADARAMIAAVRAEPGLDPARVIVIGHSEGAVIASAVSAVDRRVAAVALLAGPGRPLDVILLEQVARTFTRAGLTAADTDVALANHRAAFAAIAARAPLPDTAEAREWTGGERWLRSHRALDVVATVALIGARPVLVAHGAVDQQVTTVDADALVAAARAGAAVVSDHRYPGLDHLFVASERGDPAAYADPDRTVDRAFLRDLAGFAAAAPPVH